MARKVLALLLALCLLCPVALAASDDISFSAEDIVYLYGLYEEVLADGYDLSFDEFLDIIMEILAEDDNPQGDAAQNNTIQFTNASTYLPDPHYFFREKMWHGERDITGGRQISFALHLDNAQAGEDYITLLSTDSRFHLSLRTSKTVAIASDSFRTFYVFDYTGSADVDWIAMELVGRDKKDRTTFQAPVIINVKTDSHFKWYDIDICCSNDFVFVETDDRTSVKAFTDRNGKPDDPFLGPVGSRGKNISGGDGNISGGDGYVTAVPYPYPDPTRNPYSNPCTFCDGTGKCKTCDGYGKVNDINGTRNKNCNKCGTSGKCSYCGGSGNR